MTQKEFIQIITPFKNKLFRVAKRLLISTEEAEDATQDTLLKLWSQADNIPKINNIEAFAVTMIKNRCLDTLQSKRASLLQIVHNQYQDTQTTADKQLEYKDQLNWVQKIIAQLPSQQQLIIQLREVEEQEFSQIAQILDMNETAVRVALSRARKTIKEQMLKIQNYGQ